MTGPTLAQVAEILPPPPRYSHHRLSTYAQCPYKFRRLFIDRVPSVGSPVMNLGLYIHKKIATHLSEGAPLSNDYAGTPDEFHRVDAIFKILAIRLADLRAKAGFRALAVEHPFEIPLGTGAAQSRRTLRGRIDLVAEAWGQKVVIDWKSGQMLPTRAETEDDFQLHLYALATPEATEVWLWNLEHDVPIRVPVVAEKVDEARRYAIALADRIESEREWARRPNPCCASCQFVRECYGDERSPRDVALPVPAGVPDQALVLPTAAPLTPDVAAKVWRDIEIVRAHLKVWETRVEAARAAIEVFVDENGAVPLDDGRTLAFKERRLRRYPLDEAFRVVGDDLKDCVVVQNGLLEKKLKAIKAADADRARELEQGLDAIAQVDVTTILAAVKPTTGGTTKKRAAKSAKEVHDE